MVHLCRVVYSLNRVSIVGGQDQYQKEQSSSDRIEYSDAEREARRQKLGLWRDPHPISPWEYRQAKREHINDLESFVGKSTVRGSQ